MTEIRTALVPSILGPRRRRWWDHVGGWAELAEKAAWCRLESDHDSQQRSLADLIGEEAAKRLRDYETAFVLGTTALGREPGPIPEKGPQEPSEAQLRQQERARRDREEQ